MKFDCGKTWATRRAYLENWHPWFAWHPVGMGDNDCRWLETVERKGKFYSYGADSFWDWEYRPHV